MVDQNYIEKVEIFTDLGVCKFLKSLILKLIKIPKLKMANPIWQIKITKNRIL